jgi:hypothetical protein
MASSRLLFSGYGVGFKSKPSHEGFLGQDARAMFALLMPRIRAVAINMSLAYINAVTTHLPNAVVPARDLAWCDAGLGTSKQQELPSPCAPGTSSTPLSFTL